MNSETLFKETDYFRAFPAPEEVFANRVEEHSTFLLPVGTLALRHLSKDWDGDIHFVLPIEPCGGYGLPGDHTDKYHNYLCRPNWIGYRMIGDKCELACDFRFFHKTYYAENAPTTGVSKDEEQELGSHYLQTQQEFERHAQFFGQHGWLCKWPENWTGNADDMSRMQVSLVCNLGGTSFDGNWSNLGDFPMSRYPDQLQDGDQSYKCDRVLPRTEDGRDFHYIGEVEMWNYVGHNGLLLLFFDPKERTTLTTVDWT